MTAVQVVFPVLKGTRRFIVEKGRRWSVIEHLLLDAVAEEPASAAELSELSRLPRRVVVEAFIRLMRAGWVEIVATSKGSQFRITGAGSTRVHQDQLPAATVTEPQWRGFAIEQVTGSVFRSRELDLIHRNRLPIDSNDSPVVHLQSTPTSDLDDLGQIFSAVENEDELIVGVDRGTDKLAERYAVVTVRDNTVEGLPARASALLRYKIIQAAHAYQKGRRQNQAIASSDTASIPIELVEAPVEVPTTRQALYDQSDLIIDGAEHSRAFERIITSAAERLIIHSTFISNDRAEAILPLLLQAAERGVKIDLLWGQDDAGTTTRSSQFAAAKLQASVLAQGRGSEISIHPFSTNSHAKIIIADTKKGDWTAIIGSCNWLASDLTSFETSLRLRDQYFVGSLVRKLASLARGRPGVWNDLAIELTILGRRIMDRPASKGRMVPMRLVYGSDHAKLILEARDNANQRIFALSHRIGIAAHPVALLPHSQL